MIQSKQPTKQPKNFHKSKWLVPLIIGMALPILAVIFFAARPDSGDVYARAAYYQGVSRADYMTARTITNNADDKGELSDAEWNTLQRNLTSKMKGKSIEALGYLGKSKHRDEAISLVRARLTSKDPEEQTIALGSWYFLQMPDWKAQCQARLNHPDASVRLVAQKLLDKGDEGTVRR